MVSKVRGEMQVTTNGALPTGIARGRSCGRLLAIAMLSGIATAATAQQITLRWADVVPASHPSAQMIERIAADVKAKSGGRIVIQGFPGGQLLS